MRAISLARNEHRAIYEALSGDNLLEGAFWPDYEAGRRRRNEWVHGLGHSQRFGRNIPLVG